MSGIFVDGDDDFKMTAFDRLCAVVAFVIFLAGIGVVAWAWTCVSYMLTGAGLPT